MRFKEWLHVQAVLVLALHHQVAESDQLLRVEVIRLVVATVLPLLGEPGHPSLAGENVHVN